MLSYPLKAEQDQLAAIFKAASHNYNYCRLDQLEIKVG
jgi:hypothetical protein